MKKIDQIAGVILCGGLSSRMGEDKGFLKYKGKSLIERNIEKLSKIFKHLIISANDDKYFQFGWPVIKDEFIEVGPLGGIYSVLKNTDFQQYFFLAVDIPFVKIELIHSLIKNAGKYEIIVPVHDGKIEPLCAVYSKSLLLQIEHSIVNESFKLHNLLSKANTLYVNLNENLEIWDKKTFVNFNYPSDIQ